jgi:hypothetical protein
MIRHHRMHAFCVASLAVFCGITSAASGGPPPAETGTRLDALIRGRLGVSSYTLQDFTAPADPGPGFEAAIRVGSMTYTLVLTRSEINAPGAKLVLDDGSGIMHEVDAPDMGIYAGTVAGIPNSSVVAQLVEGRFSAMVFENGEAVWHVQPLDDVKRGLTGHVAYMTSAMLPVRGVCGNERMTLSAETAGALVKSGVLHPTDGGLTCEMACEADFEFATTHGLNASATAQDIARVMAWASKFFLEAVGVRFRITRYVIRINSVGNYTTVDSGALLAAFTQRWNTYFQGTQRDVAHLFTGRDLVGDIIGLASLGVVCNLSQAYALSETTFSAALGRRASVAAHETGHNFGANHCDEQAHLCAPCGIMLAAQGFGPTEVLHFGCSSVQMQGFINGINCLEPGDSAGACRADVNGDGILTLADFGAFQAAYATGNVHLADFNGDGVLTLADFGAFQAAYAAGCP